ncbi:MAG: aminoacyl-histidine dipeptidase [Bacteroidota bacterium]
MSTEIQQLEPQSLWGNFADLNAVPRPSKKEERVIAFARGFGEKLGLETIVDEIGNVIIRKAASPGMEDRTPVVLQSHLDMVHQKNAGTEFDFEAEGIQMFIEEDWVKAKGTTLGADNGIGVAAIMAILESSDIAHPPLEALFTIDEETGMTGAMGLKGGLLNGKIMLNLDTEEDHELTIGCAGGVDVSASGTYTEIPVGEDRLAYQLQAKGMTGGHSGMDIHRGRGNANKLMNRFLFDTSKKLDLGIHAIDGGGLRNAIPRESSAIVSIPEGSLASLQQAVEAYSAVLKAEYGTTDPDILFSMEPIAADSSGINLSLRMEPAFQQQFLRSIYACPNGIYRMSPDIEDLVQTSNNLARVEVKDGQYQILCLTRSSVDSEKMDEANAIASTFELIGARVNADGGYPGWTPNPGATIVSLMSNLYRELFDGEPNVNACHAGLECGILGTNYPEMEMISFGPNIRGAHSPDEKVQISSVQKFWGFLIETLKRIP